MTIFCVTSIWWEICNITENFSNIVHMGPSQTSLTDRQSPNDLLNILTHLQCRFYICISIYSHIVISKYKSFNTIIFFRGAVKKINGFIWESFLKCGWMGWLIPKQGPTPSKPPQITLKIALFDPNFPYRSPKSQENTGCGWVGKKIWERSPKKTLFFYAFPNM